MIIFIVNNNIELTSSLRFHNFYKKRMNRTFTTTDLILFAFNETSLSETVFISKALEKNCFLQAEFEEVVDTIDYIDKLSMGPSSASIDAILKYSSAKFSS